MRRIKLLPMLSAVLKKWWDGTNPMRDSVRRLTMKKSRIIVRTALATTLILIVAPVVFAWEPDLPSAPYEGSMTWWLDETGDYITSEAYNITWSHYGKWYMEQ